MSYLKRGLSSDHLRNSASKFQATLFLLLPPVERLNVSMRRCFGTLLKSLCALPVLLLNLNLLWPELFLRGFCAGEILRVNIEIQRSDLIGGQYSF